MKNIPSSIDVIKTASVSSVNEPGGDVIFSVVVKITSTVDTVTIDSLVDDVHGDLKGQGNCSVPQSLAPGDSYSCEFTAFVAGDGGDTETDIVTAMGTDDDNNPVDDSDDETVQVDDVLPVIVVDKTALPGTVLETGEDVDFIVTVINTSAVDDVIIETVIDDTFGDISASCEVTLPHTLAPGESFACSFNQSISGVVGQPHVNVVTVTGNVDDQPVEDEDDATVTFDPVIDLEVTKIASPGLVSEGADTVFTITVTNQGR